MPPTNSVDGVYADGIDRYAQVLGYKTAYEIMEREFLKASDATMRQAFDMDGAMFRELAELVQEYPNWNIRFFNAKTGPAADITAVDAEQVRGEKPEIEQRIRSLFGKYNKLPGLPGVAEAMRITNERPDNEE